MHCERMEPAQELRQFGALKPIRRRVKQQD
jgi:hypothetical protein